MFLTKVTRAGGELVELKTDIVKLVENVREFLGEQGTEVSLGQALIEIYRTQSGESTHTEAIKALVAALDLPVEEVWERLEKLKSYLVQISDQVEPFLLPLSSTGQILDLPLSFTSDNKILNVGEVAFLIGGEAATAITVRSFTASEPPEQWAGPISTDAAIQSLSLFGKVGFKGSASGAFGHGSLSISSTMSTDGRVNLYHQYAAATPRIEALVNSSRAWAVPWDLDSLTEKLSPVQSDGSAVGFRRVQVHGTGTVELAGGVTVGRVLTYDATVNTPVGAKTLGAKAKLGAALDFSLKRNGAFTYIIEKDAENRVTVDLVRNADTKSDRSINLGADIEVTGLNAVAEPYLDRFFKHPADLLKKLQGWTKPGDKLIAELSDTDWKHPVVKEIGQLLLGQGSTSQLTDQAIKKLKASVQQQLNENIPFWDESSGDVADKLISAIAERLDLDAELTTKLLSDVRPKLVARIDGIHKNFAKEITELVPKGEAALTKFLTPFESTGEKVDDLRVRVNARASDIVQPAIKFLKRYQDLRSKLIAGVKKVAQFKIGMAYAAKVSRERGDSSLLAFRVVKVNATTKAVHRAFLLGRINSAWADFKIAMDKGWIDQVDGRFGAFAKKDSSVSFSMHFGDIGISMTRVKASDVDVQVSPAGDVLVATDKISQEHIVKAFNVERSVGFTGAYDLAVAARDPNAFPTPLGFNLAYADDRLKSKELEEFLGSLEKTVGGRSLLPPGAASSAVKNFNMLCQKIQGGSAKARIDVALPVGVQDLAKLIDIPVQKIENRAVDLLINLMIGDGGDRNILNVLADNFDNGVNEREIAFFVADQINPQTALRRLESKTGVKLGSQSHRNTPAFLLIRQLRNIADDAEQLVSAVHGIRGIAKIQREIVSLPQDPPKELAEDIARRLELLNDRINDGLDGWLKARRPISGLFTEAVPAVTVALLGLIAELSGKDTKLVPIVDVSGVEGGQILVV